MEGGAVYQEMICDDWARTFCERANHADRRSKGQARNAPGSLPASLVFDAGVVDVFVSALRMRSIGGVTCDPKHASWFAPEADRIGCVCGPRGDRTYRGADGRRTRRLERVVHYRLYGSPKVYAPAYPGEYLDELAAKLTLSMDAAQAWCIFDNTALGAATVGALAVLNRGERTGGTLG